MYEHNAQHVFTQICVKVHRFADEIIYPGYGLNTCKAPASDHECKQRPSHSRGAFRVGFFEMRDQPVSEVDCIPQRLHRQRSLFKPWEIEEIGNRPQADDQVIIGKLVMVMVEAVRYGHELAFQIDGFNLPAKKLILFRSFRTGFTMFVRSRSLAATSCHMGVSRQKLSL